MRMRLAAAALVAAALLWCSPARATAPLVQISGSCTLTTCTFGAAPTNGDLVVVLITNTAAVTSVTVKDSNSVALVEHQPASNCVTGNALCLAYFDYIATGTPGTAYALTGITAPGQISNRGLEFTSAVVSGANYAANNSASMASAATLIATIAGVRTTDLQICAGNFVSGTGVPSMSSSNGTIVALTTGIQYALATSTNSSTCTNTATGGTEVSAVTGYADYVIPAAVTTSCGPYPWPCFFQPN